MQLAADWPRDERATVGELAGRLGYRFEAAFARALKREVGVSPGSVRRSTE
jgi:AraC-like DNA-binding protein